MNRINFKYLTLVALVLFVSGLGIRRYVMRNQIEELGRSIEHMRAQDELQERMNELMSIFMRADSDLKNYVISHNSKFLNGFDERVDSLHSSFSQFMELAVTQKILAASDTARIDSLVTRKLLSMAQIKEMCEVNRYEEAEEIIASGVGKVLIDSIWNIVHRSNQELDYQIVLSEQVYTQKSMSEARFSIWSFIVLIMLLLLFLYFLFREREKNEIINSQLLEREEKLSVTLAGISDGVLSTDKDGIINFLNPMAESLLACKLDDVKGRHVQEVYRTEDEDTGSPIENLYEQVVLNGMEIETRNHTLLRTMDDNRFVIENSARPLRDVNNEIIGMVLVFRNVTEKRNNMLARMEAEKDFRKIFENTQEGIYRSTLEGQLTLVNPSMTRIFEFETAEQMIKGVNDIGRQLFLDGATREHVVYKLKGKGKIVGYEFQSRTKTERSIWIRLNAHLAYKNNGEIDYVEGSVTDITQHKMDQENLKKQYETLREYAFINSHQVRAHVATMLGLMNLCAAKYVSEEEKDKILIHLLQETNKLDGVIRKLSKIIND